ncbi:MAG: hypothetical protein ABH846_00550 [Patescibacteria group bacterium]
MERFKFALQVLKGLDSSGVKGLTASIDVLQRLTAGHADRVALQGIMDQLPLHARLAVLHRGNPGAAKEVQRLIVSLEEKFVNMRELQARRSFEVFGKALGVNSFRDYLKGTDSLEGVMDIPEFPVEQMEYFEQTLLVDGRVIETVGLVETCQLAGLAYAGSDDTLVPYDSKVSPKGLRWVRFQDGRCNHNRKPADCRTSFQKFEIGANAMTGIARYVQDDLVLWKHFMDCPGSVHAGSRDGCGCLGVWGGVPKLHWGWGVYADPFFGSASCGEYGS